MSKVTTITLLFAGVGLLFICISLPLIKERVPPNRYYGFRTSKTLSDPKIWYEANRISGYDLLIAGAFITLASLAMLAFARNMNPNHVTATLLIVMMMSLVGALIHGFQILRRM